MKNIAYTLSYAMLVPCACSQNAEIDAVSQSFAATGTPDANLIPGKPNADTEPHAAV